MPSDSTWLTARRARWLGVLLLLLAYGLMVGSAVRKSATVDEQSHLFRGVAYLQEGATHFLLGHPLGASALSALPLLTEPEVALPLNSAAWDAGDWSVAGDLFLWQLNAAPLRLLFLGRLPVIWITLLLGALLLRWGMAWKGPAAGITAVTLLLLDPTVLAHGRLITGDLALTFCFTLTIYGFWRLAVSRQSSALSTRSSALLLTGLGLGLAAVAKFNAALLLPILGVQAVWLAGKWRSWRPLLWLLGSGLLAWGVIWLVYGLALRPLPGGAFWDDLFWQLQYTDGRHGQYLFGAASTTGWWYYFPVTLLLKLPLPTLLLLAAALVAWGRRVWQRPSTLWQPDALFLLFPPLLYLLASGVTALNIGVRYLIPMLPFLYLWVGGELARLAVWPRRAAAGLVLATALMGVMAWPDYISFFNVLPGGPDTRWRALSDSNVDWGQDLPALAAWQQAENQETLFLSYFGAAHPSAYGVTFAPLPTWAPGPEQGDPAVQAYDPRQPAPGLYAISVTNLHGVVLGDRRALYAYFRERAPIARLGGSIFVYDVRPTGPPQDVVFAGLRPMDLAAELNGRFTTNDVRVRWIEADSSFIWPAHGGLLATNASPPPALAPFWPQTAVVTADEQTLIELPPAPMLAWAVEAITFDETITFLGAQRVPAAAGEVALLTAWRVAARTERPLQLFVHALDADGEIVTQWDGLDVEPTSWLPGDVFVQLHTLSLPESNAAVRLVAGVYDRETLVRLGEPVVVGEP